MKILTVLLSFLLALPVFGQAWSYKGIPYVTDEVPDEIMPTLPNDPTGNGNAWPDYDPCTVTTPTFTNAANQYYVDSVNGNDGTAGNSGRGSVALPRQTFPNYASATLTMSAGHQIFITGNSASLTAGGDMTFAPSGTSTSPCWLIGVNGTPQFRAKNMVVNGDHLLFHSIKFSPPTGEDSTLRLGQSGVGCSHITVRNCVFDGNRHSANAMLTGSGGSGDPSEFICIYNNTFSNAGNWKRTDGVDDDRHAIQPISYTRWWWIIGNTAYHCQGDGVQVNTSNMTSRTYGARPHYIYIAGNTFYEMYEQGVDCKNSYHVIISENDTTRSLNPLISANKAGMILINNDEGPLSSYHWAIFNKIYDCGYGIKASPTHAETIDDPLATNPVQLTGSKTFIIGNEIYGTPLSLFMEPGNTSPTGFGTNKTGFAEIWVVENSLNSRIKVSGYTNVHANKIHVEGNTIYSTTTGLNVEMEFGGDGGNVTNNFDYNLVYRVGGSVVLDTADHDSNTGNVIDTHPGYLGYPDMRLAEASPARGIVPTRPACYATFQSLYGINIDVSKNGVARGTNADAGAFEWVAGQAGLSYGGSLTLGGSGIPLGTTGGGIGMSLAD